jgi:hypothetical protein
MKRTERITQAKVGIFLIVGIDGLPGPEADFG